MRFLCGCLVLLLPCLAVAQTNSYAVGSTVSGHVVCGDTGKPARFAKVLLKSTAPSHAGEDFLKQMDEMMKKTAAKNGDAAAPKQQTPEQIRAKANAVTAMNKASDMLNSSTVGMDGAFRFAAVKPGTYYVHVMYAGYVDPLSAFSDEELASADPKIKARLAQIPTITVNGTDAARMDLKIDRGAAVSGRLLYDDGTPAAGWMMSAVRPEGSEDAVDAQAMMMAMAMSSGGNVPKTDDQGRFRVAGLGTGSYVLRASFVASQVGISASNIADGGSGISMTVYSGDTFSKKAAKAMTLTAGEEQVGVDMTVPAKKLHSIVGHVAAKSDGHALNMGSVELGRKRDSGMHLKAAIRDDGSFHFEYLPGGVTYTVTVEEAADGRSTPAKANFMGLNIPDTEMLRKYEAGAQEVVLGDADVETVQFSLAATDWVPPVKKDKVRGDKADDLF